MDGSATASPLLPQPALYVVATPIGNLQWSRSLYGRGKWGREAVVAGRPGGEVGA